MDNLPKTYQPGYAQARKTSNRYRLYWRGTRNEIFPGETFRSPSEAKQYLRVQIIKANNRNNLFDWRITE